MLLVATGDELAGALRYGTLLLLSNHFLGGYNPIFWPDHMLSIIFMMKIIIKKSLKEYLCYKWIQQKILNKGVVYRKQMIRPLRWS